MEAIEFIQLCEEKFKYLKQDFEFNIIERNAEAVNPYIIFGKNKLQIKINYQLFSTPEFPVVVYLIIKEKKLFGKFFSKDINYELDDLRIYKKCQTSVYDYLDYNNIESFYNEMTEENLAFYKEKYSKNEEVLMLLDKYAHLLKDYGREILNEDFPILEKIRKIRDEYDKKYNCNSFPL